jgi:hypothetical protein
VAEGRIIVNNLRDEWLDPMLALRALIFVVASGLAYLILRVLPMRDAQRRFLLFAGLTAIFLVSAFGAHAKEAVIALLIFGMGGLLALDRMEAGRKIPDS